MTNIKEIQISDACTNCGLCEQEEFKDVFAYQSSGKMGVLHNGLIDLALFPKVSELTGLCPVQAINMPPLQQYRMLPTPKYWNRP